MPPWARSRLRHGVSEPPGCPPDARERPEVGCGGIPSQLPAWRCGRHGSYGGAGGAPSTRSASIANPPIPSASTWWKTTTRAHPESARSVTNVADHSGCCAGKGVVTMSAASARRDASSPGAGQTTSRTWCDTSNPEASSQMGRPQPAGVAMSAGEDGELRLSGPAAPRGPVHKTAEHPIQISTQHRPATAQVRRLKPTPSDRPSWPARTRGSVATRWPSHLSAPHLGKRSERVLYRPSLAAGARRAL